MEINRSSPVSRSGVCVWKENMHSGVTQKAPPPLSPPASSRSSVSLSLRRQKSELKGRSLPSRGKNKQRQVEGDAQTERLGVDRPGPHWAPLGPPAPHWAALKCRLRHHPGLCVSSRPTPSLRPPPPPPPPLLRLSCSLTPALQLTLSRSHSICSGVGTKHSAAPNCHIQPRNAQHTVVRRGAQTSPRKAAAERWKAG